jgi:hypothetical protein
VRDCNEKRILVAKAAPAPEDKASLAKIVEGMKSALMTSSEPASRAPASTPSAPPVPVKTQQVETPQSAPEPQAAAVPLPPARPQEPEPADVPLPPRKPTSVALAQAQIALIPPAHRPMVGSARILPDRFTPYAYVIVRR